MDFDEYLSESQPPKPKRKGLSKKVRFDVFKRDSFECQYCGAHPPSATLHVDHINPVANGGGNDPDNLVTACDKCNLGKGARLLSSVPESLSAKSERIKEQEDQVNGYFEAMQDKRDREIRHMWMVGEIFCEAFGIDDKNEGLRRDWLNSIKMFNSKLGVFDVIDSMDIAIASKAGTKNQCFKYFCGVCWNKVRVQDNA